MQRLIRSNLKAMRTYGEILKPDSDMIRPMFWKTSFPSRKMIWRETGMKAGRPISKQGD